MISQVSLFEAEELKTSQSYRGGSLVSLTALTDCVKRLLTSVIYGQSTSASFGRLNQDGLWEKTLQGYSQASLDGSLVEYCETWPTWGLMLDGQVFAPHGLEPSIRENAYSLLPTPQTTDQNTPSMQRVNAYLNGDKKKVVQLREVLLAMKGNFTNKYAPPSLYETLMGFPTGWTELNPLGTA